MDCCLIPLQAEEMAEAKLPSLRNSQTAAVAVDPVPNQEEGLPQEQQPCEAAEEENHLQSAEEMVQENPCETVAMPMAAQEEHMSSASAADMQAQEEHPLPSE